VPRVKAKCIGYLPYNARVSSFAKSCRREIEIRATELKRYPRQDGKNQRPFLDSANGTYRCSRCAGAFRMIKNIEKQVKKFWTSANPHHTFPKIQSLKQLREIRRACYEMSYRDDSGGIVVFHPERFQRGKPKGGLQWGAE
jgi:hypothetical protein